MMAIDRKDLLILRKLEWRGRIDPSEIGRAVGLPKEAVKKRIERLEGEGVIKGISLSLFPPPVLGGEWMWLETSIVTKGGNAEAVLQKVKEKVPYFSEAMIHTPLPKGVLPDLVVLYYTQDPKKDLKTLRSLPEIVYAESTFMKNYNYPIPVDLSKEEWRFIQILHRGVRQSPDELAEALGMEKKWVETKLELLLWTEENRKGVFLALPFFDYRPISNFSHFHFSLDAQKGFDRKQFESSLNGSGILPLPPESGFRGNDHAVESDVWGLMDLEKKLEFIRNIPKVELSGMVIYRESFAEQPWLKAFIEGKTT